jgi:hypothetical protein
MKNNMSQTSSGFYRKEKWYNRNIFPLIPVLEIREENEHNNKHFSFRWLFFHIWSLDHLSFELSLVADTHWGIGVIGIMFYLRWVFCIPCPESLVMWLHKHTNRYKEKNDLDKI